jgi:hypothetical protein
MRSGRGRVSRWWIGTGILSLLLGVAAPGRAAEQILFGPAQYTRTTGPPNQFDECIALPPTLTTPFRLHFQNGNLDGSSRISGATITVNGNQVAGPSDFSENVSGFDRSVSLRASNTLQVRLTSKPGSFLVLTVYATIPPPTLSMLEPPTLPITQGATGTLTATISALQSDATTISLQSSSAGVVTVPAAVSIPANQLSAAVTVTAIAPGTATITAALNESSVQSTVTVCAAGPTLTSLLPAALQVAQGAAGSLTATISAAQATDTVVSLASSDSSRVGLPPEGSVTVPAGQLHQAFAVFGTSPGHAPITASLNGSTAQSQVTVVIPLPAVVSLQPPAVPLTAGSTGLLTVALNASQPADTEVLLTTSDSAVVGLPGDRVIVPADALSGAFVAAGKARGMATVTASLNGSNATAAITVSPPPPTIEALTCPAALSTGATTLCTLTLNATQLTDTAVDLVSTNPDVVAVPPSLIVPANTLTAQFVATGGAAGSATLTAGPLNGTNQGASVQVISAPATIGNLLPAASSLVVGATASLTLTLNAVQPTDTVIPLGSSPKGIVSHPASLTVLAGSLTAGLTVTGLTPGTTWLTAGNLNETSAQTSLTVSQLAPVLTPLIPSTASLPKGKVGTLRVAISPTQPEATAVLLTSSDPAVEIPGSVTIPAGADSADVAFLARAEGTATLTAGPLNGTSQQVQTTATPAELVTLVLTPPSPTIAKGETQAFTATGTYTDGTTPDLTGTAAWTSSKETVVASITSPGGLATGNAEGQATITATVGSATATATLTVTPPEVGSLVITPVNPSRAVGETVQLQATGTLTDGTVQDVTAAVTWSSDTPAVATISAGGLATALSVGTATLTAMHPDGFTASTVFTVVLAPPALTSFSPSAGPVGTTVTLVGTNLGGATQVTFNGVPAAFVVVSPLQLTAAVPPGATTGSILVTTPSGSAASAMPFTVLVPPTLTITSPVEGATINADRTLVTGTVRAATADAGVIVNGMRAFVSGTQWVAEVPLAVGTNALMVTATDATGMTVTTRITVTASESTPAPLLLQAVPTSGVTPLVVTWQVTNQTRRSLVQFQFDPIGSGTFGSPASSFDGVQSTYSTPGVYYPVLRATDDQGTSYVGTAVVSVMDRAALDAILQARWTGLKANLMAGDAPAALHHFLEHDRPGYAALFTAAGSLLQDLGADMPAIQPVYFTETVAKYRLRRQQQVGGSVMTITHYIYFSVDADGTWRIDSF